MFAKSSLAIAAGLVAIVSAQSTCDPAVQGPEVCSVRAAFGPLVPGIVPFFEPSGNLIVGFDNIAAIGGAQQLAPSRVANPPRVAYNATAGTTSGPLYTILMVDPDAPTPANPTERSVLHWMVTNLQVDSQTLALGGGTAVAPYAGPNPPQGSPFHRYLILLYTQPTDFALPAPLQGMTAEVTGPRLGFDFVAFAANTGLGQPVGGIYFGSAYDGSSSQGNGQDAATLPVNGAVAVPSSSVVVPSSATVDAEAASTPRVTRLQTSTLTRGQTTVVVQPSGQQQQSSAAPSQATSPAAKLDTNAVFALLAGGIAAVFEGMF